MQKDVGRMKLLCELAHLLRVAVLAVSRIIGEPEIDPEAEHQQRPQRRPRQTVRYPE